MRLRHSLLEWVVGGWALLATLVGLALLQRYLSQPAADGETPPAAITPSPPPPLQSRPALPC